MDFKMSSSTQRTTNYFPVWDFVVENGIVPMVNGNEENVQTASIAAFINVGTVPQLPNVGVPWVEYLTNLATFGDIDAAIRQAVIAANVPDFSPQYDFQNGKLTVTMKAIRTVTT